MDLGEPSDSVGLPSVSGLLAPSSRTSSLTSLSTHPSKPSTATLHRFPPTRTFSIVLPTLSEAEKELYKMAGETSLRKIAGRYDEIIGEYTVRDVVYYFARYKGGIANKFSSIPFTAEFPQLVKEYKCKRDAGALAPFNPAAHYVHPLSRIRPTITLVKRSDVGTSRPKTGRTRSASVPDSTEDAERSPDASDTDDHDSYDASPSPYGSKWLKSKRTLPFSPRTTRSKRVVTIGSDFEDDQKEGSSSLPTRRSTRARKSPDTRSEHSEHSGEDSDEYTINKSRKKIAKIVRKVSRPAYGHFRDVEELDYDFDSDDETAPLRAHRAVCEKCQEAPAHDLFQVFSKTKGKGKKKKKSEDELEYEDRAEHITALGGWVRCLKCPAAYHWQCIGASPRDEILKAARHRNGSEWEHSQVSDTEPKKRLALNMNQTTEFICNACLKGGSCMGCMQVALTPDPGLWKSRESLEADEDESLADRTLLNVEDGEKQSSNLLFRCLTCKRIAHWEHLPRPPYLSSDSPLFKVAEHYTETWYCADCATYQYGVDKIIAWRPDPPDAKITSKDNGPADYRRCLSRKYLVKWRDRSYRRVEWVPHMWLLSTHRAKLQNFLNGGSKVELVMDIEVGPVNPKGSSTPEISQESRASSVKPHTPATYSAVPDAENRIPPAWKTVDRVLDVYLWNTVESQKRIAKRNIIAVESDSSDEEISDERMSDHLKNQRTLAYDHGEQPDDDSILHVFDWEVKAKRKFCLKDANLVAWAFIKWEDLGYDEATWDSPPRSSDTTYQAFEHALQRFIGSQEIVIAKYSPEYVRKFDSRRKDEYRMRHVLKDAADLHLGQDSELKLMPFQVDGFNWLCNNWWNHQNCILADEMGLGKTVQVASFLGNIIMNFKAAPALVVVPNTTITNWVRELERWAPKLRVVPFYGEAKAREVIKKFELSHRTRRPGHTAAKFHVLVTTYETLSNPKEFTSVFKSQSRWEVLIVDEGQRLKNDSSLLFRRLNELKSIHRIVMTGTPLNNNIRELFNLMNFLDPNEWSDLESLEKEHEELTEDLVKQLHNRLRPYFLRRLKSEVLQLPPKNEVIVPVSMAPLQREVYRSILGHNLELLKGFAQSSTSRVKGTVLKGSLNNVLMQLRKCLQHPYLYAEHIEPRGLSSMETHEKLIDGSAKLRLLRSLLPRLKQRGHRVLLFSQFTIALDVIEDFLAGEGYKFLRIDGNTKNVDRQKGMDEFNKPGSDVFIYLLTTRAGGVGINLFSADTVIIFDPDFNPHQDLQAISRAYRYGQQKTCLVFKLMVKDSAEERIIQVGKKKLALDHLIVQKMDDEEETGENVRSILTYGAQALFDENQGSKDITYTDQDIEKLVERTEREGEQQEQTKEGLSFSFAKIWTAERDSLEEVRDAEMGDSWAQTLERIIYERDKIREEEVAHSGRGVRRRAAVLTKPNAYRDDPFKDTERGHTSRSDESAYSGPEEDSGGESDASSVVAEDMAFELPGAKKANIIGLPENVNGNPRSRVSPLNDGSMDTRSRYCGLCAHEHGSGPGQCIMTNRSENLAEFRAMLLLDADDEPWDRRIAAIEAIDRTLMRRGHQPLIAGQPLHPVRKQLLHDSTSVAGVHNTSNAFYGQLGSSRYPTVPPSNFASRSDGPAHVGPSKRPASPLSSREQTKVKKNRLDGPLCQICRGTFHLVKDCPVVKEGPQSILKQIKRLENHTDSQSTTIVQALRKLLQRQLKKQEASTSHIMDVSG